MQDSEKRKWVPEIMYEDYEDASFTSGLPFITIPDNKEMPDILWMFGTAHTGEYEPGDDGEPEPIVEIDLYQFANMKYLKEGLEEEVYDKVRICLGLDTLNKALSDSKEAVNVIASNIENTFNSKRNI